MDLQLFAEKGADEAVNVTKSEHAVLRASQRRNVSTAINDLQRAKPSDVLLQEDGRWVIKGQNGRVHIIEPDGELVTTMNKVTNSNIQSRFQSGRWSKLTLEQEKQFEQVFNKYINWNK